MSSTRLTKHLCGAAFLFIGAATPSLAHAEPRLLVTDTTADVVLDFTALDGGDISGSVFASGLSGPAGLCVGPDNQIYVGESQGGEVTIITDGGDQTDTPAFASVDPMIATLAPAGLWCSDEAVILASTGFGSSAVVDITVGGTDYAAWTIHVFWPGMTDVPAILDLARMSDGALVTSSTLGVLDGGIAASASARPIVGLGAGGENVVPLELTGMRLIGGANSGNIIYDLSDADAVDEAAVFATVPMPATGGIIGLLEAGDLGLFAATREGIYDISGGGDHTADAPVATGLSASGLALVDMVFHECTTDDDCGDADACNGEELCSAGRCQTPEAELDCDDADACTADSCDADAGCTNETIESCCVDDLDCSIEEVCDPSSSLCVPASAPTGGDDSVGESDTGMGETAGSSGPAESGGSTGGTTPEATGAGGTDTDGSGEDDLGGEGCGCQAPGPGTPWLLLPLLAFIRRRRRNR